MKIKRFIAWLLCVSMMLSIMPVATFAQEDPYVEAVENLEESSYSLEAIGDDGSDDSDSVSTELPEVESGADSSNEESLEDDNLDELNGLEKTETSAENNELINLASSIEAKLLADPATGTYVQYGRIDNPIFTWNFDGKDTLTISGEGELAATHSAGDVVFGSLPWGDYNPYIKKIVLEYGITNLGWGVGEYFNKYMDALEVVEISSNYQPETSLGYDYDDYQRHWVVKTDKSIFDANELSVILDVPVVYEDTEYIVAGVQGIPYVLENDGTLTLQGEGETWNFTDFSYEYKNEIKSVVVTECVTGIGDHAFYAFPELSEITFLGKCVSVGSEAFEYTPWYNKQPNGLVYINNTLYRYKNEVKYKDYLDRCEEIWDEENQWYTYGKYIGPKFGISVKEGTTCIADGAFAFSDEINGNENFCNNTSEVESLYIPNTVEVIGYSSGESIKKITVSEENRNYKSIEGNLFNKACTELIEYFTTDREEYSIPDGVRIVHALSFGLAKKLYIPESVEKMPNDFGYWEDNLVNISVSKNNSKYSSDSNGALYDKVKKELLRLPRGTNVTHFVIENGTRSCDGLAAAFCKNITEITIPRSMQKLGYDVFARSNDSTKLKVNYYGSQEEWNAIQGLEENEALLNATLTFGYYPTSGNIDNNITWEFDKNSGTLTITGNGETPDYNVSKRPWNSFCEKIKNIKFDGNITALGTNSFSGCSSLKNVELPLSIKSIKENAFKGCESLSSIQIPLELTSIGQNAFAMCNNLKNIFFAGAYQDWNKIHIDSGNSALKSATIIVKSSGNVDISKVNTKTMTIFVYEKKEQSFEFGKPMDFTTKFFVSDAQVIYNNTISFTDIHGKVEVPYVDSGNITIICDNYNEKIVTAKQLKESPFVYLTKVDKEKPTINSVVAQNVDVLFEEFPIDIVDKNEIHLEADVVWTDKPYHKLYLRQGLTKVEFVDGQLDIILSDYFDVSKTISIVAIEATNDTGENQVTVKSDLLFKSSGVLAELDDYSLDFGNKLRLKVPDDYLVIGGMELGVDISDYPITFTVENGKIHGLIGFKMNSKFEDSYGGNYMDHKYSSEVKSVWQYIKSACTDDIGKKFDYVELSKKINLISPEMRPVKLGFDADCTVYGFFDGYVNSNGKVVILDAGAIFNPSVTISKEHYVWFEPPIFFEASLKGELEAMLNLYVNDNAKNFTPDGSLKMAVTLRGGVGVGVKKILSLSGGLSGNLTAYEQFNPDYISLSGSIGAYAKVEALCFDLFDKTWNWSEGIIAEYPSTKDDLNAQLASIMYMDIEDEISNPENHRLSDRSYINHPSEFVANESGVSLLFLNDTNTEQVFKTNVYPGATPLAVGFDGDKKLLVWIDDDTNRLSINRTALYYSYFDGNSWTTPAQIDDDGTADYYPVLKVFKDHVVLAWSDSKKVLSDTDDLATAFSSLEISTAEFINGKFDNYTTITNNNYMDIKPVLFGDDNNISVAWINSFKSDVFSENISYNIYTSNYNSSRKWGRPLFHTGYIDAIDSMTAVVIDDETNVFISKNTRPEIKTHDYFEIFLNEEPLTEDFVCDSGVITCGECVYWYSNGEILEYNCIQKTTRSILNEKINTDRFVIIGDSQYKSLLIIENGTDSTIKAYMWDKTSGDWSKSTQVMQVHGEIKSVSGFFTDDGILELAVCRGLTQDLITPIFDIVLLQMEPVCDLLIENICFSEDHIVPGNIVEFDITIKNNGTTALSEYSIDLLKDKSVVSTLNLEPSILPGNTYTVKMNYAIDENFCPHAIDFVVRNNEYWDNDETNNKFTVMLDYKDLSVENIGYGFLENGNVLIFADIINRGYSAESAITVTLLKGTEKEIVSQYIVSDDLASLEKELCQFEVGLENDTVYYVQVESNDMFSGNDSDFVVISLKPPYFVGDLNGDDEVTDSDAIYLMYYTFFPEEYPINQECDFDGDGEITDSDAVYLMYHTFFPDEYPLN